MIRTNLNYYAKWGDKCYACLVGRLFSSYEGIESIAPALDARILDDNLLLAPNAVNKRLWNQLVESKEFEYVKIKTREFANRHDLTAAFGVFTQINNDEQITNEYLEFIDADFRARGDEWVDVIPDSKLKENDGESSNLGHRNKRNKCAKV